LGFGGGIGGPRRKRRKRIEKRPQGEEEKEKEEGIKTLLSRDSRMRGDAKGRGRGVGKEDAEQRVREVEGGKRAKGKVLEGPTVSLPPLHFLDFGGVLRCSR